MFNHLTAYLSNTHKGMALALLGYTAFSFSDASVKYASELGYSIYQVIAVNTLIGAVLMLAFAPLLGGLRSLRDGGNTTIHALRIILNTAVNFMIVYCFSLMPITSVYTAVFILPFVAAMISIPLFAERIGLHRWISIGIGFVGVLIAFRPWQAGFDFYLLALPLGTTVLIASMFLAARKLHGSSPLAIGFYPVIGCCLIMWPLAIGDFMPIDPAHLVFFVISGLFLSLGIICVSLAFQSADSAAVTPIMYSQLLWAILFGVLVFGDFPDKWMLIGAGVIILSGIYLLRSEHKNTSDT